MSDLTFPSLTITDDDVRSACRQLGQRDDAFHGADGADPRAAVLKEMSTIDVAACPGSGKTTLLVAKLAILAQKWNHRTRGICVLSHTNVARTEIEKHLGNSPTGLRLLGYPHFIGTIHSFVNEFLALPWLRSLGYPINTVDSDICANRRWHNLPWKAQGYLEKIRVSPHRLQAMAPDFTVGDISIGKKDKLGNPISLDRQTDTYQAMVKVCEDSAKDGYFCHDEMFVWANDFLDKHPEMISVIRDRYPLLFVDECQDNDNKQASLLFRLFCQGASPAICQRYGDGNQAIFNHPETDEVSAADYLFPLEARKRSLPNSHRFGQVIADLADPLGLVPYKLQGQGPKLPLASGEKKAKHTLYLFQDPAGAERVLVQFGELLLDTFSDGELRRGVFKAVGQVHKKPDNDKFPAHVGHYWKDYDARLSKLDPKPDNFVGYVLLAREIGRKSSVSFTSVQIIADGIFCVSKLLKKEFDLPTRKNRHRSICEIIEPNNALLLDYEDLVLELSLGGGITKAQWDDETRARVLKVAEYLAGTAITPPANLFLQWPEGALAGDGAEIDKKSANIYHHAKGDRRVAIQLGSIHSAKGETHTATLVLETFYRTFNIAAIKPWLLGSKQGAKAGDSGVNARLKLHYVAMTRPSHLICIAMLRSAFETEGKLDAKFTKKLNARGWRIQEI